MIGSFVERADDPHGALRQEVLRQKVWYPGFPSDQPQEVHVDSLASHFAHIKSGLEVNGAVFLRFNRALTNDELIDLANLLGKPQKQGAVPLSREYVDDDLILNLRADHTETSDLRWGLLFAENYVTLHTELASRPLVMQPRYIILHCIEPPQKDAGGQTILVPMECVRRRLNDDQVAILYSTRYAGQTNAPYFLRRCDSRDVFSFKDAEGQDLPWQYEGDDPTITPNTIEDAIRALLCVLYEPSNVRGFHWQRWALGVIDNTRFFHGRTFARLPLDGRSRHLRRLQVSVDEPFV